MDPPFELRILGPTELRGSRPDYDGPNPTPPKRLALLAYLAVESAAGYRRRDQIVGYFWPELEQEAARTQLRKALFAFRESLGADAVLTRGEGEVRLDPTRVWCDAVALGQYAKQGRWDEVLALYRGELLEGLYPEGVSQEFEEWLADKRKALREQAALAAWERSRLEEAEGDRKAAAVLARRALELTPDDEAGVRQLMSLLDRQGDRAGALRVYTDWQSRLQAEYGVEPAPETRKLARKVQAARKGESHETPPTQQSLAPVFRPAPAPPPAQPPEVSGSPAPWRVRTADPWKPVALVASTLLLLTLGVLLLTRWRNASARVPPQSLAVLPLRTIGDSAVASVAAAFAEELSVALIQDSTLTVRSIGQAALAEAGGDVDRIGQRFGVAHVVDGGVQRGAERIRLTLRLVRSSDAIALWAGSYDLPRLASPTELLRVATDAAGLIRSRITRAVTPQLH